MTVSLHSASMSSPVTTMHPLLGKVIAHGVERQERRRLRALKLAGAIIKVDAQSIMHRYLSMPDELRGLGISLNLKELQNTVEVRRFFKRLRDSNFVIYYCDAKGRTWRLRVKQ